MHPVMLDYIGVLAAYEPGQYPISAEQLRPIPSAVPAIRRLSDAGWTVILASSDTGVETGNVSAEDFHRVLDRLLQEVEEYGGKFRAYYFCGHGPGETCACRKPEPGLLVRAARDLGFDPSSAVCIDSTVAGVAAAHAAGCYSIMALSGEGGRDRGEFGWVNRSRWPVHPHRFEYDLDAAVDYLLTLRGPAGKK